MLVNTWQMISPHLISQSRLWWDETSGNNWLRLTPCDIELIFNSCQFFAIISDCDVDKGEC